MQKQKGIVTYGMSPNRQNPLAGTAHAAVFNTWRRFKGQVLYVVPPFLVAYYVMNWATERLVQLVRWSGLVLELRSRTKSIHSPD